jgi:Flp pilus assembly protein TadG
MRLRRRTEDGAAAVEFALVLPILLVIVFAIISFGFVFAQSLAMDNAARQTTRYGVIQGRACSTLITEAKNAAEPLVKTSDPTFKVEVTRGKTPDVVDDTVCSDATQEPCKDSDVDDNLYITLSYNATLLVPVVPGKSHVDLSSTGVFRCEFS